MARLTDLTFNYEGSTYRLTLDFDDAALMEDTIAFDVTGERTGRGLPNLSARARVEVIPSENTIVAYVGGEEVFRSDVYGHTPEPVEQIIQGLPAQLFGGDPILGCAVKAGISSIIGQAINCCRGPLEANSRWRIVAEFLHCMSQNFGRISRIAMFRAFKCILGADDVA